MVGGYMTNKNIYQVALAGNSTSTKKPTLPTGGTYANGIAGLTPTLGGVKTPAIKVPDVTSQFNSNVVKPIYGGSVGVGGGGSVGGITKEGVITGNMGVTKMPTIGAKQSTVPTKLPNSTAVKYSDILQQSMPKLPTVVDKATTPVMTAQHTEAATTPTQGSTTETAKETPATYEEYLEQQRELLDQRKAEADRQAEAAKERAAVDAQASFAQNMATYGTNAENLAQISGNLRIKSKLQKSETIFIFSIKDNIRKLADGEIIVRIAVADHTVEFAERAKAIGGGKTELCAVAKKYALFRIVAHSVPKHVFLFEAIVNFAVCTNGLRADECNICMEFANHIFGVFSNQNRTVRRRNETAGGIGGNFISGKQ